MTKSTNATSLDIPVASPVHSRLFKAEVRKEWIEKSAVSEKYYSLVVEEGFLSIHRVEDALKALKRPHKGEEGCRWAVRGVNPQTGEMNAIAQVKLNADIKYASPKDSGSDAVFLPLPSYFPNWRSALLEHGLVICEGVKKAAALISQGIPAVSAIGCQCFYTHDSKGEVRANLAWAVSLVKEVGASIFIIPDGDIDTNKAVFKGTALAATKYIEDGIDCKVIHFKGNGKGIDDHLATIPEEERRQELERIMTQEYSIEKLKEQLEKQFSGDEEGGSRKRKNSPVELSQTFADNYRDVFQFHSEQQVFRQWNGTHWEALSFDVIHAGVRAFAFSEGFQVKNPSIYEKAVIDLRLELLVKKWVSADRKIWINFKNGIYNTVTREFYPDEHKPELLLLNCLEREYVPIEPNGKTVLELMQEYCPTFYRWAKQALNKDELVLKALAAINAIATFRFSDLQMFLYTYGKPGTGKGTFNRLLEELVGEGNSASTRLDKLGNDYEIAEFIGKQLVICPDEDRKHGGYSVLKSLTGGDTISYRPIYGKPARSKFHGSLVVTANDAVFGGDTTGLDRRMVTLGFNNVISERDSSIESALKDELSTLTSIALWMPPEEVKALLTGKSDDAASKAEKWVLKIKADAVAHWMEESVFYSPDSDNYTPKTSDEDDDYPSLYTDFTQWSRRNGYSPANSTTFFKRLYEYAELLGWKKVVELAGKEVRKSVPGTDKRPRVVMGVALKGDFDSCLPTISELLADDEDSDEVSTINEGVSTICPPSCPPSKPLLDMGCPPCPPSEGKLLQNSAEEIAEFFEGEQIEIYTDTLDMVDTNAVSSVSASEDGGHVQDEWKPGDGFYVGQKVYEREKNKRGDETFRIPERLYKGQRNGRGGIVREIEENGIVSVWFYNEHERNRQGGYQRKNGKLIEQLTRIEARDLVDADYSISRIPFKK